MNRLSLILVLAVSLTGCSSGKGTLAELRRVEIVIEKENVTGSVDKAIESYEHFLEKTEETPMTPEAIRRLADLKVEKEYGLIAVEPEADQDKTEQMSSKEAVILPTQVPAKKNAPSSMDKPAAKSVKRPSSTGKLVGNAKKNALPSTADLERTGAREAIVLYQKLLDEFPEYERNDQTLYQLSRAHEEQGQVEKAMSVMNQLVVEFPDSHYMDEVQFRRAEYFFVRRDFISAEEAYGSVVAIGEKSNYYLPALYKLGWSYYKQELYEEALHQHMALLDFKVMDNFDFNNITDNQDGKRVQDTIRIISQSFSNLGGVNAVDDYFSRYGNRVYADIIYANLGEYFFSKQRYNDAVKTYNSFVEQNLSHRQAPLFSLRVIEINKASGFASLFLESKKAFANRYAFGADYWKYFNPDARPEVVAGLRINLSDLAKHYHALTQNGKFSKKKPENLEKAMHWYQEFLSSFPLVDEASTMNYQLAELMLENKLFAEASREYERTAYSYPAFEKSGQAGYAAVYASRQNLQQVAQKDKAPVKRDVIRLSIKFAEFYPEHEKAAIVFSAAIDDLYTLPDFQAALTAAKDLLERFPKAKADIQRSAWLVVAHSSYELEDYVEAEAAYAKVLQLLPANDKKRSGLIDNLAASVYKQGEAANNAQNHKLAAKHFLRVATVAPKSKLRPTAEFDGVVALIKVEEWQGAADVLSGLRKNFPKHELQHEITKKLAYVYREDEKFALAAVEFQRIEAESKDPVLRQEALLAAAELYERVDDLDRAVTVYRRYVGNFPEPADLNIEIRDKLASILKKQGQQDLYLRELEQIVIQEAAAGAGQTDQTRLIASNAALILVNHDFDKFIAVRLVKPFEKNLQRKQALMKKLIDDYTGLFSYEVGEVTAETTFRLAEIYADFSVALLESERPEGLSALELEQYDLALEEQAYPFEEKAIEMHQSNLELLAKGIYNDGIIKSMEKLAIFMPARYGKTEVSNSEIASLTGFQFENLALNRIARDDAAKAGKGSPVFPPGPVRKEAE